MFNLDTVASVMQIFSVVVPFGFGVWSVWRKVDKRQSKLEFDLIRVSDKLDFIVKQFGHNGGGLRQAVNELTEKVCHIEDRQIDIGDKVARLDGKFEQHIVEND
jgi:ABC-type nickel/cobalt efflux system permease component RcnA